MFKYIRPYEEPWQAKTTRENLHDTTMAVDSIFNPEFNIMTKPVIDFSPKEKATNFFADTICEFSELLTPEELYQCLVDSMEAHYQYTKKEFDHATQLRDLITGFKND